MAPTWRVRQLTTKSQFIALSYGQLEGAPSLRDRGGAGEPQEPAVSPWREGGAALDPVRGQCVAPVCAAPRRGVSRSVRGNGGAGASAAAPNPLAETTYLIDSTLIDSDRPAARRAQPRSGALLGRR